MPGNAQADLRPMLEIFWRVGIAFDWMMIDRVAEAISDRGSRVPNGLQVMIRKGKIVTRRVRWVRILPWKNGIDITDIPAGVIRVVRANIRERRRPESCLTSP
jgi:hypothetical protein